MATFHPFPRLPYELRAQIWQMSVQPRTVEVDVRHWHKPAMKYITSSTPTPRVLQVCREARNGGLYQKCFTELSHPRYGLQHVWLNLDIDIVDTGKSELEDFKPVAESIHRLKLEREYAGTDRGEDFCDYEINELRRFVNLKELYFVCADGLYEWEDMLEDCQGCYPCGAENVFFIDSGERPRVLRGPEGLEQIYRERQQAWLETLD